jgi:DNA-binding MarR family transcriptional regulator
VLTDAGRRVQQEAAELLAACEQHYLEPLSQAERRELRRVLGRLVRRDA